MRKQTAASRLGIVMTVGAAVLAAWPAGAAADVFDDFSDMNDTVNPAWTHLDAAVGSTGQTWDASTGAYRLHAPSDLNNPHPDLVGYGFVGSYVNEPLTDVRVTADL
jgi:hypothetical protein